MALSLQGPCGEASLHPPVGPQGTGRLPVYTWPWEHPPHCLQLLLWSPRSGTSCGESGRVCTARPAPPQRCCCFTTFQRRGVGGTPQGSQQGKGGGEGRKKGRRPAGIPGKGLTSGMEGEGTEQLGPATWAESGQGLAAFWSPSHGGACLDEVSPIAQQPGRETPPHPCQGGSGGAQLGSGVWPLGAGE